MPEADPLDALLEAAFHEALKKFAADVHQGLIDPVLEQDEFRRRRRDYASSLRMGSVPDEAMALAAHLLQSHKLHPAPGALADFQVSVTRLLIRLHDAFIDASRDHGMPSPHGSR